MSKKARLVSPLSKLLGAHGIKAVIGMGQPSNQPWEGASCYAYEVTLSSKPISLRRRYESFTYYGSIAEWESGDSKPNSKRLSNAVQCIFDDAIAYMEAKDIDDFASNFGYTKPSAAIRAYEGCKDTREKLSKLGLIDDEIYEVGNKLGELA